MIDLVAPAKSLAFIVHEDDSICHLARGWLEPFDWICRCEEETNDFAAAAEQQVALFLIDARISYYNRQSLVAAIRTAQGSIAGTPILLLTRSDAPGQNGVSARIDLPVAPDEALAIIAQWTGPVADHGFRDLSDPYYRLIRLAGRDSADRLLRSFVQTIENALERLDQGGDMRRIAHELAGLAGTIGFGQISDLWSVVERNESADIGVVRGITRRLAADLKGRFSVP